MSIVQSIDGAREARIGPHGIAAAALDDALGRAAGALDWLRERPADGKLPLLRLAARGAAGRRCRGPRRRAWPCRRSARLAARAPCGRQAAAAAAAREDG